MVTMADVARRAKVTKQTVSHVLSGNAPVSEQTRRRVLAAIDELGYRPNLVARGLAKGKTYIVALMLPTITNPYYAEIVEEVEAVAEEHQYHLLVCTTQNNPERGHRHIEVLSSRSIDGLLLLKDRYVQGELTQVMQKDFPTVLGGWEIEPYPDMLPVVTIDFRHAGYLAGNHLFTYGHRTVGVISELPAHTTRLQGFQAAFAEHDLHIRPEYILTNADSSFIQGYQAAQTLLQRQPRPTALFATNDLMALGAIEAIIDAGLRIPDDVSIVGVDDIPQAAYTRPPLTTIAMPKKEMARELALLLLRCMNEKEQQPRLLTMLRPQLIVRHSTASRL